MATRFVSRPDRRESARPIKSTLAPVGTFLSSFLKQPLMVGSPVASSRHMVDRLLDPVDWQRVGLLVEYGPGTGSFTAAALSRMRSDATLLAIDTSQDFTEHLRETIPDPRLRAVTASAADAAGILAEQRLGQADCILSGLPFSTLPEDAARAIVAASDAILKPGGLFMAYQMRDRVRSLLDGRFDKIDEGYEWRNLPPCHLYWFRKRGGY
jgi:phospholipid N-methyltransferase